MYIDFIPNTDSQEWQIDGNLACNLKFANKVIPFDKLLPFEFSKEYNSSTFAWEKATINEATNEITWGAVFNLTTGTREDGYYTEYTYGVPLTKGYYRLIIDAESVQSFIIFEAKNIDSSDFVEALPAKNEDNASFADSSGNIFTSKL